MTSLLEKVILSRIFFDAAKPLKISEKEFSANEFRTNFVSEGMCFFFVFYRSRILNRNDSKPI